MILAVSRFRVANGKEGEVRAAFHARPRLVDSAPGFLGMETFTDSADASVFYLVTRWTDADSFRAWHHSPDHHASHRFIPRGLKLDPSSTKLFVLERLREPGAPTDVEESVADAAPLFARHLSTSRSLHYVAAAPDGTVLACSRAVAEALGAPPAEIAGRPLWRWLPESDAAALRERAAGGARHQEPFLVNFSDSRNHPYTLRCRLDARPDGFVLVGEPPEEGERALRDELIELNNRLSVLTRENGRQNKELKRAQAELERAHAELGKAHDELKNSHWHLKKISEVLPICMECGKVRTGEAGWGDVVEYLKANTDFLSHSYCPDCYAGLMGRYGLKDTGE